MQKRLLNSPADLGREIQVALNGESQQALEGELVVDLLNRLEQKLPQVCFHAQMGPIETCDTCMVQVNSSLVRACATELASGMKIETRSDVVDVAQREAFDRILENHLLYCTVCDNNNGNCTIHNTTADLDVKHQSREYRPKPYEQDHSNPFYRYDPTSASYAAAASKPAQNVQVNETLTITGKPSLRGFCGTAASRSPAQAVSRAAIALRCARATR